MAEEQESQESRTEEPTPRRRAKAREEGRIARSQELSAAALLVAGTALLATVGGRSIGSYLVEIFRAGPSWLLLDQPSAAGAAAWIRSVVSGSFMALLPFAVGLAIAAVATGLVQSRGTVSWKPVAPDWSRVNPLNGFKRIFGTEALVALVKSTLKLVILGTVTYHVLDQAWPEFVRLGDSAPIAVVHLLRGTTVRLALTVGLAFLGVGVFDYAVQHFRHEKSLKMSRQEVIQEHREQEGDPHVKARIRQIARQRARKRMLAQVAKADVVITNPTHIAVALKYDTSVAAAPVVVAMGERKLAERIKLLARGAGVPIIENKPLARALLATATVGAPIPPLLYVAVAEILAFVFRSRRSLPAGLAPAGARRSR